MRETVLVLHMRLPAVGINACLVFLCRVSIVSVVSLLPCVPTEYCKLRTLAKHRQRYSHFRYAQHVIVVHYPEHVYPELLPLVDSLLMPLVNTPVAYPLCFKCCFERPCDGALAVSWVN